MDVPSTAAGTVTEVLVQKGGKIAKGGLIARIEGTQVAAAPAKAPAAAACCRTCREVGAGPRSGPSAARGARSRAEADETAQARRAARSRNPVVSSRCRSRWLHRGVPRRRSRPQGHAGGTLADAGRRLPQCRLHSVQGAAACRQGHRRSRRDEPSRRRIRRAENRPGQAAQLEEQRRQETGRWPVGAGEAAQGRSGHGRGQVRQPACHGSDWQRWQVAEDPLRAMHHRRRLRGHQTTVHPRRSARHRFDGCARAGRRSEASAGHRWRHHRPGNGHGVRRAGREVSPWSSSPASSCPARIPTS